MNERVWVKHGWTTIMCALVLLQLCLGQKDCTGVDCPHLDNCIEEVLEDGACCATCSQRGCICKGYQYYDCNSAGFKEGKVPEGESYLVDSGSTECWCPAGGGNISCRFIPCPDVPPHCIELSDSTEACSHCLRLGCVHHNHKYEAGHSFHMDPCQVCHCPNEGGELMCSVIPDCSSEMAKNPEVKKNELHVSKHEHPGDFLSEEHKLPSNSVPKYTENRSEFEEEEDYDYFPEATASPYTFVSSSATLQTQNPHEVLHEDTRKELKETLGTYEVESREEETEDSLNSPITETDSRSYETLSQTETIARHTQVPPRKITTITTDDIQRTERNPDPYRDLHHTIPELNTLPKLQFISTTKPPVNVREREAHRQPQILGRYHQEGNGLHLTSNNQRVNSREIIMCCEAGENWASAHSHCNNMVPLRTDLGSTCWWAQRQCCSSSLRETQCSSGINTARRGRDCGADDPDLCDSYMECCMCCVLGLQLQAQQQSCDPLQGLGVTCSHALLTCCEGTGSTNQSSVRERTHPQATSPPRKDSEGPEHQAFSVEEVEDTENMVEKTEGLEDVDECRVYAGQLCHHQCVNTQGSYVCVCFPGFVLQRDGIQCLQEVTADDENGQIDASPKPAETSTTPPPGLLREPCEGNGHCAHHCHLVEGRDHCFCSPGFSLMPDGHSCEDIDECFLHTHSCQLHERCENTVGSFRCVQQIVCPSGYQLRNDLCEDTDECETGVHRCGEGQICHNIPGTYRCDCHPGYQYDMYRRTCADVNECWRYSGRLCAQTCENTPGSYRCSCNSGFTLSSDGKSCEDVNECLNSSCSHECVNVYGSYKCYCRQGYYLREDTHSCEDIDECSQSIGHLCAYKCVNIPGSYDCACPEHGYSMAPNRRSCHDIDECTVGAHNCTADETCYNVHGGFRCLSFSCPTNYRRASDTGCERISCSNYLECQNSPVRITYYQLSFQTNIIVPALIFRMGPSPAFSSDNVIISISSGNEDGYFSPRKLNAYTGAIYLQRQLPQPRDFLLNVEMKLWRQSTFTTFLARIYIFITANVV
ncbi:hypothetical protein Q7C36_019572 [Tachysurus vachellii]|uniref:Fibulin 2 n=1 Tax=Tachysurus vachellii TaxID=175792 RepID=A0AA88S199_TACVA|nr:hypothetical protein Q7C36_019572 [Tachysurus vachellii]